MQAVWDEESKDKLSAVVIDTESASMRRLEQIPLRMSSRFARRLCHQALHVFEDATMIYKRGR